MTSARRPLTLPPGDWSIAVGPTTLTISSRDMTRRTEVTVAGFDGTQLSSISHVTLPGTEIWRGGAAACVSTDARLAVADSAGTLYLVTGDKAPEKVPGQKNSRGGCAWLDGSHLLWDQEGGVVAVWDRSTGKTTTLGEPAGRDLSAGGGRLAWTDPGRGLVVSDVSTSPDGIALGQPIGTLPGATGWLSAEGHWLLAAGPDELSATIYEVSSSDLKKTHVVSIGDGEQILGFLPANGG
jgi:hypothetical protein